MSGKHFNRYLITITMSFFVMNATIASHNPWWFHPVLALSLGGATAKVGHSQKLTMPGDLTFYDYTENGSHSSQWLLGGFAGTEIPLHTPAILQVGFGYYQPANFSSGNGVLIQGVDLQSADQFAYRYYVKSQQFLIEGKLLGLMYERYHPYASFGLGVAVNTAMHYTTNVPPFLTFTRQFSNQSTSSLTYTLGVGMDVDLNKNWRLGGGYRFTDLGKVELGPGLIDTTPFSNVLTQSHLYAQELIAQLTYVI